MAVNYMNNNDVRRVLETYTYAAEARKEVMTVWPDFKDLRPVTRLHISHDGRGMELIGLEGLVSVQYKDGKSYNMPIRVSFPESFPAECPQVLVTPKSNMSINKAAYFYVGMDGIVTLSYLKEWKYPKSNLLNLLNVLCIEFGKCTPVVSIDSANTQQTGSNIYKSNSLDATRRPYPSTNQTYPSPYYPSPAQNYMPSYYPSHQTNTPSGQQICTVCVQLTQVQQKQAQDIEALRKELRDMKQEMQQMNTEMQQMKAEGSVSNSSDCVD